MQRDVLDFANVDAASVRPLTIRILIIVDGRIRESKSPIDFGLDYVVETLRTPFAWWVRFHVDVVRHDSRLPIPFSDPFRLTDSDFDINNYDQIWFFADRPNKDDGADGAMTDADIRNDPHGLTNGELKVLAEWMDRGGGVFATGDHTVLGGAMCHRIPRVRSMRRWTLAQGVPPRDAATRHETLQPGMGSDPETDTILQPLELVQQVGPFGAALGPHPLFQSGLGLIDRFPDHMHEGEIVPDADVPLDSPLDIPGYGGAEYPSVPEVVASHFTGEVTPFRRPRPRIVAYGRTTNPLQPSDFGVLSGVAFAVTPGTFGFTERFGLVGVYDGDAVGIGRIVVDSTWHHWLSLNVRAIAQQAEPVVTLSWTHNAAELPSTPYRKMQAYYRNVVLWLATPAQRRAMLLARIFGTVVNAQPDAFSLADSAARVGKNLRETFGREMTPGLLHELVGAFLPQAHAASSQRPGAYAALMGDAVEQAMLGGIGKMLLEPALAHREQRDRGLRPALDVKAMEERALAGATAGRELLSQWLNDAAAAIEVARAALETATKREPMHVAALAPACRLRVVAKRLQLPDSQDPALVEGPVTVTLRARLGDDVIGVRTLERVELPRADGRGVVIDLDLTLGEAEVAPWESLAIDVLAGDWSATQPRNSDALRFEDVLRAPNQADWIGEHTPARSQPWRLWYAVERAETPSSLR